MFYDVYIQLCIEKGISPSKAAQEIGFNKSSITNWKNNGYTPRQEILMKIAEYFNVSTDYLLGKTDEKNKPTTDCDKLNEDDIKVALFDGDKNVPDEAWDDVKDYIKFIKGKYNL